MAKKFYNLIDFLKNEGLLEKENKDIYNYGLFSLLGYLIPFLLLIFFGSFYKIVKELIIFYVLLLSIRVNIGGFHLDSYKKCFMSTFIIISLTPTLINYLKFSKLQLLAIFLFTSFYIGMFAPVDTKNKRLSIKAKRKLKKRILILFFFWGVFVILIFQKDMIKLLISMATAYLYLLTILILGQLDNIKERRKIDKYSNLR